MTTIEKKELHAEIKKILLKNNPDKTYEAKIKFIPFIFIIISLLFISIFAGKPQATANTKDLINPITVSISDLFDVQFWRLMKEDISSYSFY